MTVPRIGGIQFDPGKEGAVYPSQCWTSLDHKTTGIVRAKLSQNLSRNMATKWPCGSASAFRRQDLNIASVAGMRPRSGNSRLLARRHCCRSNEATSGRLGRGNGIVDEIS